MLLEPLTLGNMFNQPFHVVIFFHPSWTLAPSVGLEKVSHGITNIFRSDPSIFLYMSSSLNGLQELKFKISIQGQIQI